MHNSQRRYTDCFKASVVDEVVSGKITRHGALHKYGLGGKMTVDRWLYEYGYSELSCFRKGPEKRYAGYSMPKSRRPGTELNSGKSVRQLERELDDARLIIEFQNNVFKLASEEAGYDIKKTLVSKHWDDFKSKQENK